MNSEIQVADATKLIVDMRQRVLAGEEVTREEYITAIEAFRELRLKANSSSTKKAKPKASGKALPPTLDLNTLFSK